MKPKSGKADTGIVTSSDEIAVVIVAAGRGERAGSVDGPKQYQLIGVKSVLTRCLECFENDQRLGRIVVVRHADDEAHFNDALGDLKGRVISVIGGSTRQTSVFNGLSALSDVPPKYVLIHDAARPFVSSDLMDRILEQLSKGQAVLPALPVSDTLKRGTDDGLVAETVNRSHLYGAQTPQAFVYRDIFDAHDRARASLDKAFTDDASIAEWAGLRVMIVPGSVDNIKITWKRDIEMANQRLASDERFPDVRTGNGYDVHSFVPGDFVTLCGVRIAHEAKLNGHSDSDVALHALTDALLATCGAGDIGTHFPPSDMKWKGAASRIFVEHAVTIIREKRGRIANVDITLICETPKVGPHREAMVAVIADMINIDKERISVKATTNEKLGFIGRKEGIAAIATASVVFPGELR
ncbi:MAG: bifunctional 2-C-methyl-D-erythritol 4-phosphate cytidylyltransferase/2-C-methyl-D-erythritol 2,4-cyclodiphosphate synthase [Rhizobiaceae bacterium]